MGRNVNITSTIPHQVAEVSIAVDPRNPDIIVAGAMDFGPGRLSWAGYYRSTDGGKTWSLKLIPGFPGDTSPEGLSSPLRQFDGSGDPQVAFDRSGNLFYSADAGNSTASGTGLAGSVRVIVAKFTNDGANFAGVTVLSWGQGQGADFPRLAIDTSGGTYDGNLYLTFFSLIGGNGYGAFFTRSTDGGLNFSSPIPLRGSGLPLGNTPLMVDNAGNVFVASIHCTQSNSFCSGEASGTLLVVESTNGGLTFGTPVVVAMMKNYPNPFPGNSFWSSQSAPSIVTDANGIYMVWDDFGTGDTDILFARSTDGGITWSSPLRVNDVTQGQQFFSAVAVSGGVISVEWYDSRLGQLSNGTISSLDVFYAESQNAGVSFSKSVRVTSVSFNPNIGAIWVFDGVPFIGDYIGIAAGAGVVHAIWTDNRNACDVIDSTFGCVDSDSFTATISGSLSSKSNQSPTPLTPFMTVLAILTTSAVLALHKSRVKAGRL